MKILFTKKLDKNLVSNTLGNDIAFDTVQVISIRQIDQKPFELKNKSLIFSSVNAVESFFANGFKPNENLLHEYSNKIYAVGLKTKNVLRKNGFGTFKVAKHASELSRFIIKNCEGEKFLHFCGNLALDVLDKTLPLQNIWYKKVVVYETDLLYPKVEGKYDAVCFFSPSGVRSFAKFNSLDGLKLFSIGETTERELRNFTDNKIFTSKESNLDDLLKLIKSHI